MKHSRAPWTLEVERGQDFKVKAADGYSILSIPYDPEYGRPEEDEANARLISRAPKMLATLCSLRDLLRAEGLVKLTGALDGIIADAGGE